MKIDQPKVLRSYAWAFSRDLTAATGAVAHTGAGFRPRLLLFFAVKAATESASWGFAAIPNTPGVSIRSYPGGLYSYNVTRCIQIQDAGGDQAARVDSFDADGFTLGWTKTTLPTGTADIMVFGFA